MARFKRIFYILLLNILVSAVTIWLVLAYWERRMASYSATPSPSASVLATSGLTPYFQSTVVPSATVELASSGTLTSTQTAPAPTQIIQYRVKKGDTLGSIAVAYGITVEDIMLLNNLTDPNLISVDQLLFIPTGPVPTNTLQPTETLPPSSTAPPSPTPTASATPTYDGIGPQPVIDAIIGAGDLADEQVRITRTGNGDLSLAGWRLEDSHGNVYIFPQLDLYAGGSVTVHTTSGLDTVSDLFWNLKQAVWQSGEKAILRDPQGKVRVTYVVP